MNEKRFITDNEYVMQNGQVYVVCGGEHSADVVATALNELINENEQLKQENEKLHSKIFEMRTNEALERTEISKQSYDGYKTAKEFLKELEKW